MNYWNEIIGEKLDQWHFANVNKLAVAIFNLKSIHFEISSQLWLEQNRLSVLCYDWNNKITIKILFKECSQNTSTKRFPSAVPFISQSFCFLSPLKFYFSLVRFNSTVDTKVILVPRVFTEWCITRLKWPANNLTFYYM